MLQSILQSLCAPVSNLLLARDSLRRAATSYLHCSQERLHAEDVYDAREIIGEHV